MDLEQSLQKVPIGIHVIRKLGRPLLCIVNWFLNHVALAVGVNMIFRFQTDEAITITVPILAASLFLPLAISNHVSLHNIQQKSKWMMLPIAEEGLSAELRQWVFVTFSWSYSVKGRLTWSNRQLYQNHNILNAVVMSFWWCKLFALYVFARRPHSKLIIIYQNLGSTLYQSSNNQHSSDGLCSSLLCSG